MFENPKNIFQKKLSDLTFGKGHILGLLQLMA